MKINDLDKLLQEGKTAEAIDMLLEELDEVAENKATEDKEPEAETPEVENKDVYNDETEPVAAEEVKEVVVEEVEPVQDKEPEELQPEMENDDVYPEEEHQEAEEVKEVVVENEEISEDVMEINPEVAEAEKDGVAGDTVAPINVEADEEVEEPVVDEVKDNEVEETVEKTEEVIEKEIPELKTDEELTESLNNLFAFLKKLNEEEAVEAETPEVENKDVYPEEEHQEAEEVKEVVVENEQPEELQPEMENDDVYPEEEHQEAEEVKEVVVEEVKPDATEDKEPEAVKPEIDNKDVYPEDEHLEEKEVENPELDNEDIYNKETEPLKTEEVKEVVVENELQLSEASKAVKRIIKGMPKSGDTKAMLKPGFYDEVLAYHEGKGAAKTLARARPSFPVSPGEGENYRRQLISDAKEEIRNGVRHSERSKYQNQPKGYREGLKSRLKSSTEKGDNAAADERKELLRRVPIFKEETLVEDIVTVVVEAAKLCKEAGIPGTLENITAKARTLFECDVVAVEKDNAEKQEYDVDAAIESSEMNGNDKEFKDYEEIQGEGAEAAKSEESVVEPKDLMKETVEYKSLKEACMLDEDYFVTDTYSIQTSEEKLNKLTEQVSLLLAREHMDPMYDELLKNSVYCKRLHEALLEKYYTEAVSRTDKMIRE